MTTFVVTTSADVDNGDVYETDLSLREAIGLANASAGADRITFADGVEYLALTNRLPTISDGLRLVGGSDVVLDANADGDFDKATTAEAGNRRGLDIRGDDIAVTIDGLSITGGSTSFGGGGIRSGRNVDLTVVDSQIVGNVDTARSGGGVKAFGDFYLLRTAISGNVATTGGGIAVYGDTRIIESTVRDNRSGYFGGSVFGGGGIFAAGKLILRSSAVINNQDADEYLGTGGGIRARKDVYLFDSQVSGNRALSGYYGVGGGIRADGTVAARDSIIADNLAGGASGGEGGGIFASQVRLNGSEVSGNTARGSTLSYGGGIDAEHVELRRSTIADNLVDSFGGYGGGIRAREVSGQASTIASNTLRSDSSYSGGGGIDAGLITLHDVTLTGNEVTGEGHGGAIRSGGEITLRNSLVVGNFAGGGENAMSGHFTRRSSIVSDDGREVFTSVDRIAPGVFAGVLDENSGLTRTVALRYDRDNPAIGGANPETATPTDQRGVDRDDHPDIGAFEGTRRAGITLTGTARPDVLQGSDARDKLDGREGDDLLRGLGGRDNLRGGADDDVVRGNSGQDMVDGGGGSDEVFGGRGDDVLRGGGGTDRFVFFARFGVDTITDFDARPAGGQELIDLRHLGISTGNFQERVTITDVGSATLVAVEDAGAILCRGITDEGGNAIGLQDFFLLD